MWIKGKYLHSPFKDTHSFDDFTYKLNLIYVYRNRYSNNKKYYQSTNVTFVKIVMTYLICA